MATYYVELDGGQLTPDATLKGGTMSAAVSFSGAVIYPSTGGGGGGGNMQTKSVSYTPTESAISDAVTPDPGYDGMDKVNVSVGAIPSDYVGSDIPLCDSSDVDTTISDTNLIRSHTVNVADGYYENSVSLLNPFGEAVFDGMHTPHVDPSTGDLTVTFSADTAGMAYTKGTYTLTQDGAFNVKGAQTYTPGTTDQTINSGYLLTGNQTILGDADLVAENIKKDVEIFGVTGTYEGGSPTPDPYHISIDGTEYFFTWGGADWNNNRACQNSNTSNRRSLWSASGDTVVYYLQNNGRTNLRLIPIPSDVTTMTLTLDQTCQFAVREYWGSGSSLTSSTSTSWLDITANTPYQFTLSSGSNYVGFGFRVNSSNSNYTNATELTTAAIDFS